ncbi:helix-turn-helix transcriptional regulator [Maritalea porphyrae]|uniref:helix-turn-helix transcriptional regulator n=1 Tax=Maritalea porphyrae TaxID=880732 RepID=UPI0022AF8FEB|nr:helix-turn-helix transcriptional regulator [Maritalea porphyrae]MCZ4271854.1 helix-turn-helix transcriptional regulator [Maritalea porphyrae]
MNFHNSIIELSDFVRGDHSLDSVWRKCSETFAEVGIDGIGYGIIPFRSEVFLQGSSNAVMFRHSYPQGWADDTGPQGLLDNDITASLLVSGRDDMTWVDSDDLLETANIPTEDRRRFATQDAIDRAYKMNQGVTVALDIDNTHGVTSGMGLRNSTMSDLEFVTFWNIHRGYLKAICSILDTSIRKDHLPSYVGLTTTERDCLNFAESGRQFAEIEYLMRLSEDQVKKTFSRCRKKLQAKTRDHAVAKALVLGLITP